MSFLISKQPKLKEGLQFTPEELAELPGEQQEMVKKALEYSPGGFDLRTHVVEPRSGILLSYQPYRRTVDASGVFYFRKDKNGQERRYTEQGHLADAKQAKG